MLLSNGHINVVTYRWRFFLTVMEYMSDKRQNDIVDNAIATRAAKMEQKDFVKFVGIEPKSHEEIYNQHQEGTL